MYDTYRYWGSVSHKDTEPEPITEPVESATATAPVMPTAYAYEYFEQASEVELVEVPVLVSA